MRHEHITEAAENLAVTYGYVVFPCRNDKRPACPYGFHDASREPEDIRELWRRWPGPLVGVATGEASGLAVLDLDARHPEARAWWARHRERLLPTRTHRTRGGGLHLLFRNRPGLRCSASRISRSVDTRAEGGYVVWWPATGCPVLAEGPIAAWPEWLVVPEPEPVPIGVPVHLAITSDRRQRRYAEAALGHACERVVTAGEGGRNSALNREAWGLMRLAVEGALAPAEIADGLAIAALRAGLDAVETARTIASALRAGGCR